MDMVFAVNMLHFTEIEKAIQSIAYQLKPGGTFAAAVFGFAFLDDTTQQDIWIRMFQRRWQLVAERNSGNGEISRDTAEAIGSAYDAVNIPEDVFHAGAVRLKINFDEGGEAGSWHHMSRATGRLKMFPYVSRLGQSDVLLSEKSEEWTFTTDLAGLKDMLDTFPLGRDDEILAKLWAESEATVGDQAVHGVWPVSLILATRK